MTDIKPDLVVTDLPDPAPSNPLEALEWLGGTVEEVVEGLRARGIKGLRRQADGCIIASYLHTWWPTAVYAFGGVSLEGWNPVFRIPVDSAVCKVEALFDSGRYPDLIAD